MALLVVAALQDEIRGILPLLSVDSTLHLHPARLWQGELEHREISILVTGVGKKRMSVGLQKVLQLMQPTQVLHIGYAGAATPLIGTGKLVVAEAVIDQETHKEFFPNATLAAAAANIADTTGRLLTVASVIEEPMEKAALGAEFGCVAVDMESAACAAICQERGLPWLVARAVFDSLEMRLPHLTTEDERGEPQVGDVLREVMAHPKEIMQIPQLQYCATQARNRLTQFVQAWVSL